MAKARHTILLLIGLILLEAAWSKIQLVIGNPFADLQAGIPIAALWFVVFLECAIAYLNFAETKQDLTWLINIVTFCGMLAVAATKWYLGYDDCGCGGVWKIHPAVITGFDAVVVTCLLIVRPFPLGNARAELSSIFQNKRIREAIKACVIGLFVGTAMLVGVSKLLAAKPQQVTSSAQWHPPASGHVAWTGKISIANQTNEPLHIIGCQYSCQCLSLSRERFSIAAQSVAEIAFELAADRDARQLPKQRILFFVDHPEQSRFSVDIACPDSPTLISGGKPW